MSTFILWLRILLTIVVIGFPLYHIVRFLFGTFNSTSKHLQDQIDKVKSTISQEPVSEDELSLTIETQTGAPQEDLIDTSLGVEEQEELVPAVPTPPETNETQKEPGTEVVVTEPILEEQKTTSYTGEKLLQTVEDIKYAALAYKERGKKDDYEKKLVEGISLVSDHEEFLTMLADHYFEEGLYIKASTLLKKVIHLNPENHRAIRQLGQIYAQDNDKETAKLLLEKARDLKDDNPKYLISLVEIYYEENNLRECIHIVEKLSKLRPKNMDYLLTLAKLHEELNQPTKAHSYYMKVLELNPNNDEAKKSIKRLL